jgi:hypothetical protein
MNRQRISRGFRFLAFGVIAVTVFGFVLMSLWNWLVPPLTGWHSLGFAQALGLLVLCRILFGRFGGRRWQHRGRHRWSHLSTEEQEQLRSRCGWRHAPEEKASS